MFLIPQNWLIPNIPDPHSLSWPFSFSCSHLVLSIFFNSGSWRKKFYPGHLVPVCTELLGPGSLTGHCLACTYLDLGSIADSRSKQISSLENLRWWNCCLLMEQNMFFRYVLPIPRALTWTYSANQKHQYRRDCKAGCLVLVGRASRRNTSGECRGSP